MEGKICAGCGCNLSQSSHVIVTDVGDKEASKLPDGLAYEKKKIFQVNMEEEDGMQYAIFEYYLEYGTECIAVLRIVNDKGELLCGPVGLPIKALIPFVHFFEQQLAEKQQGD